MKTPSAFPDILIVEDDDVDVMNIERCMRRLGAPNTLRFARDGSVAQKMLKDDEISLPFAVIVDLNMPRVGGHELIRWIRQNPNWKGIPIMVLTTSDVDIDKEEAWELGISGYFLKELSQERFLIVFKSIVDFINNAVLPQ
jgi:CheY-like chemotaxis protein